MLTGHANTVARGAREDDSDTSGHEVGGERLLGEGGDEVAPSLLGLSLVMSVVEHGRSEGAGHGQKYQPVSRG